MHDPRIVADEANNAGNGNGNGGNDGPVKEPDPPKLPWSWAVANWSVLLVAAVLIVVALGVIYVVVNALGYPKLPALATTSTVEQVNSSVGATLVQWGLALTLVAFIPALILSVLGAFKIEEVRKPDEKGGGEEIQGFPEAIKEIVTAVPALLKIPGGFGVVLILLGVLLMSATALGGEGDRAGSPSPGPTSPAVTAPPTQAP